MAAIDTTFRRQLFINGKWVEAQEYSVLRSPYTSEPIAEVPMATKKELEEAIEAAYAARKKMAKMPIHQRSAILDQLVKLLVERSEEAAKIISLEAAKPITTAREEVRRTIQTYKFAAQEATRIGGETISLDAAPGGENRLAYTVREPLGVIGAITPFNFPMNLVAHKLGPAIATGNTVVLKPASQTPLSSFFIAELLQEAGLPDGALNVVTGSGSIIGDGIVMDHRVSMITFTGSPSVGIGIRNRAGLKRTTLELGSNAAVIIDKNTDIDKIIPRCVQGAFSNQGQVCISLQRIYVHEDKYDEFVKKLVDATRKLKVGNPLDEETNVSALISKKDVERTLSWIKEAKDGGATIATGGYSEGNALYPTVILNATPNMLVSCQEVFAPIVIVNKVKSVQEAIAYVNNSRYGLQAGIYTKDITQALDAADDLEVGGVIINDIPTFRVDHMPYGGVKESGTGKEGIKYAIEEMTEMKLVVINRN
ncbi:MAG TPA: aldehyde dehydrogenase family protein [Chondromyces sp.]|nr:aldehyde dehydrogenase family protein [Chondromyces sp.]